MNAVVRIGAMLGLLMLGEAESELARAATTLCIGMKAETFPLVMPSQVSVPRDLPYGSLIGPWIYSANSHWADCMPHDTDAGIGYEPPPGLVPTDLKIPGVIQSYTVFRTSVPGVGVAFAGLSNLDLGYWMVDLGSRSSPWPWTGKHGYDETFHLYGQLSAVLVKIGPVTAAGRISLPSLRAGVGEEQNLLPIYKTFSFTPIDIVPLTCAVSDVSVDLGEVATAGFKGVGSSTGGKDFTFKLRSCPAGFKSIGIQVHPTAGTIAGLDDVAQIHANSTAKGVGVKLQWSDGSKLRMDSKLHVAAYTGQAADIPLHMNASYYQTETIVRPGTANASFEVTLFYE